MINFLVQKAFAQASGNRPANNQGIDLPNPLDPLTSLEGVLGRVIYYLTIIAIPIVAIMVIIGAFQILFARGNPEGFEKGKRTILYAVIGFAVVLLASSVVPLIKSFLRG